MRILIASDIHGSAFYCRKLLEAYREEKAERMLLLGDILYHGPRNDLPEGYDTKAVSALLNAYRQEILCVRGNCDAEVDQWMLEFPLMADYCVIPDGSITIYATHGHIYNEEHLPPLKPGDILLHGHTHIPACREHGTYTYLNPGSVSIPKEGSHRGYMIYEDGVFTWKDLEGNVMQRFDLR